MRLSTSQIFQQSVNSMLNTQAELAKTQLQLSNGKRIQTPSDDPSAATSILDLSRVIATTDQYQRNADMADSRLAHEETVLTEVGDILQRVRELTVSAVNGTQGADDRRVIAIEIRSNLESLVQLANTQDSNGEYIFAGFKTDTIPVTDDGSGGYAFHGDQGQRNLQIGAKRQVAIGDSGADVFMKVDDGAGGNTSMFEMIYSIADDLENNIASTTSLTQIDSALNNVIDTRASIGARMNSIEGQRNSNDSFVLLLQENRSSLEDLDYTEAVSRFEQQLLALQASQQSFSKIQGLSLFNYL